MSYLVATKTKFLASSYRAFRVWVEVPDAGSLAVGETFDEKINLGHRCIVPEGRFPDVAPIDLEKTNGQRPNNQSTGTDPAGAGASEPSAGDIVASLLLDAADGFPGTPEGQDLHRDGGQPAGPAGDEARPDAG